MRLSRYPVNCTGKKRAFLHAPDIAVAHRAAITCTRLKRLLLAALLLPLGLFLNGDTQAQTTGTPVAQPIVIDAKNPSPIQGTIGDKFPADGVSLEIKGDGKKWRFIIFEDLSPLISIKVRSKNSEGEDKTISRGIWYPFKDALPLILTINPQFTSPIVLSYRVGIGQDKYQEYLNTLNTQDLKDWAKNNNDYIDIINTNSSTIRLFWGPSTAPGSAPIQTISPSGDEGIRPLTDIFKTRSFFVILIVFILIVLGALMYRFRVFKQIKEAFKAKQTDDQNSKENASSNTQVSKNSMSSDMVTYKDGRVSRSTSSTFRPDSNERPDQSLSADASQLRQQDIAEITSRLDKKLDVVGLDKKLDALREELENKNADFARRLQSILDQKLGRNEKLYAFIQQDVALDINKAKVALQGELATNSEKLNRELGRLDSELLKLSGEIASLKEDQQNDSERIETQFKEVKSEQAVVGDNFARVIAAHEQVEKRLQGMERAVEEKANELFHARMLGVMLENKVDVLSEGGFQSLIDRLKEGLDGFFKEDVERNPDILQELKQRADAISAAFKKVVEKIPESDAQSVGDASKIAARASTTAIDLSTLQSQIQSRQFEVITTSLRFPITAHSGARRTFLEELALGLKREIEKLSNPKNYFENQLESLATSEVISLADICDHRIGRKEDSELEQALQELFAQAGLCDIVPKRKDAFKTVEQELVEMVPGEPQDRLKVAEVLTRGFVYKRNEQETLLRKAGVKVYR